MCPGLTVRRPRRDTPRIGHGVRGGAFARPRPSPSTRRGRRRQWTSGRKSIPRRPRPSLRLRPEARGARGRRRRPRRDRADRAPRASPDRPHAPGAIGHRHRRRRPDPGHLEGAGQGHGLFRVHRDTGLLVLLRPRLLHREPIPGPVDLLPPGSRQRGGAADPASKPQAPRGSRRARGAVARRRHPPAPGVRLHVLRLGIHRARPSLRTSRSPRTRARRRRASTCIAGAAGRPA